METRRLLAGGHALNNAAGCGICATRPISAGAISGEYSRRGGLHGLHRSLSSFLCAEFARPCRPDSGRAHILGIASLFGRSADGHSNLVFRCGLGKGNSDRRSASPDSLGIIQPAAQRETHSRSWAFPPPRLEICLSSLSADPTGPLVRIPLSAYWIRVRQPGVLSLQHRGHLEPVSSDIGSRHAPLADLRIFAPISSHDGYASGVVASSAA